jgi:hypothetical protein
MKTDSQDSRLTEEDFAGHDECDEPLSDAQINAIVYMTYRRAVQMRRLNKFSPEEEAAYFQGAMAVFFACHSNHKIPACWVLGPRPVLESVERWKAEGKLFDRSR